MSELFWPEKIRPPARQWARVRKIQVPKSVPNMPGYMLLHAMIMYAKFPPCSESLHVSHERPGTHC